MRLLVFCGIVHTVAVTACGLDSHMWCCVSGFNPLIVLESRAVVDLLGSQAGCALTQ